LEPDIYKITINASESGLKLSSVTDLFLVSE
jgi:hypothetical protein